MPQYLSYDSFEEADRRSREMWAAVRGSGWCEGDVTTHLYGVRRRVEVTGAEPGGEDPNAGLPDGVDFAIVIHEHGRRLDKLLLDDFLTVKEIEALGYS